MLAREIERDPKVLIAAQPTRGLDVGAIEFVHRRLITERDEGRGVLLVSLELEEIFALSDRILVMFEGRDRRRVPAGRLREHARARDDRRRPGGRGMSARPASRLAGAEQERRVPPRRASASSGSRADGADPRRRFNAQGLVVSITTRSSPSSSAGSWSLATGHNPLATYRAIFNGTGLTWLIPWVGNRRAMRSNLQQTLIVTTPLDPVRARGRVRLPLRDVQHRRPGPVLRRLVRRRDRGLDRGRHARPGCTSSSASSLATVAARSGRGSPAS